MVKRSPHERQRLQQQQQQHSGKPFSDPPASNPKSQNRYMIPPTIICVIHPSNLKAQLLLSYLFWLERPIAAEGVLDTKPFSNTGRTTDFLERSRYASVGNFRVDLCKENSLALGIQRLFLIALLDGRKDTIQLRRCLEQSQLQLPGRFAHHRIRKGCRKYLGKAAIFSFCEWLAKVQQEHYAKPCLVPTLMVPFMALILVPFSAVSSAMTPSASPLSIMSLSPLAKNSNPVSIRGT